MEEYLGIKYLSEIQFSKSLRGTGNLLPRPHIYAKNGQFFVIMILLDDDVTDVT